MYKIYIWSKDAITIYLSLGAEPLIAMPLRRGREWGGGGSAPLHLFVWGVSNIPSPPGACLSFTNVVLLDRTTLLGHGTECSNCNVLAMTVTIICIFRLYQTQQRSWCSLSGQLFITFMAKWFKCCFELVLTVTIVYPEYIWLIYIIWDENF